MTESKQYPGFHHVPGLERYAINREDVVIDTVRHYCPLPTMAAGYRIVYNDGVTHFVHRLKALTFLDPPEQPVEKLDVNHKDGDKLNNEPSNLEWATRSENCIHAYQTGLRNDNRPVLVKDLRDDTVARYYSLQECARAFGVTVSRVHQALRPHNRNSPKLVYYVFIYEGEDWPCVSRDDIGKTRNGMAKSVAAKDTSTGKIIIAASQGELATYIGVSRATISYYLSKKDNSEYKGWRFHYLEDQRLHRARHPNQGGARRKPTPIKVHYPDGKVVYWDSTEEFGKSVGVSKNTIQAGAHRNNGMWRGYRIEYM